jgi:cobalt-zinc-cadmium efflux system membrane fusion protein
MVAALEVGQGMKVRLPSMNSAAKVGIQTSAPYVGYISDAVECLAELAFNQNKLAQIAAPVAGILRSVDADLGAKVEEGALLAKLWSAAISEAVSKAVLSQQTVERERKLRAERVSSERELQEAEAAWRAAREHLIALGFDDRQIAALEQNARAVAALEIRAPFAGEIIERAAVRGTMVEAGKPIFTLTDTTTMWVTLHIPESQLNRVRVGQRVELTVDSMPDYAFGGTLTWIAAQLDERTRMIRARAEVPNSDGRLKARMFARARILTSESSGAVVVPQTAIQQYEGKSYVFIKHADDLFEARVVRLGAKQNGRVEIINGLRADEQIVVERSYAVKSEMLKSRLGAGCCE